MGTVPEEGKKLLVEAILDGLSQPEELLGILSEPLLLLFGVLEVLALGDGFRGEVGSDPGRAAYIGHCLGCVRLHLRQDLNTRRPVADNCNASGPMLNYTSFPWKDWIPLISGQRHLLRIPEPLARTSASSSWMAPLDSTLRSHLPLTSSQTVDAIVELKRTRSSRLYLTVVLLIYSQISDPAASNEDQSGLGSNEKV